jgi:hypothetical protein
MITAVQRIAVLGLLALSASPMRAADNSQTITIDWSNAIIGQQPCASISSDTTTVTLQLNNVNDLVYKYRVEILAIDLPQADASNLPSLAPAAAGISYADAEKEIRKLFDQKGRNSISLAATQMQIQDLKNRSLSLDGLAAAMDTDPTVDPALKTAFTEMRAVANGAGNHSISVSYTADKQHYYVFGITEINRYTGMSTNKSLHWKCGFDDTLSLSVGVLFTQLPFRSYNQRTIPGASGTQNVLEVDDAGPWTPVGVGLLNYKLVGSSRWVTPTLSLASGPVYKFGGTPQVSGFGWFAGISASAWNRVFITPGVHVGEFADYPLGFGNGTTIPTNFGTLTPVKRWSARFAVAITFRTNTLVKSKTSGGSTTPSSTSGGNGGKGSKNAGGAGNNGNANQ